MYLLGHLTTKYQRSERRTGEPSRTVRERVEAARDRYDAVAVSARAYHHMLKLARTIADLAGSERIGPSYLAEVLQFRPRINGR